MKLLDLTLRTPEENLALDEAILETADTGNPHVKIVAQFVTAN